MIQLSYERFSLAIDDFNDAIKHDPTIGDAFVNRGAAEIGQRKFAAGRDDIDHGLTLGADEPQKAYYNRGLADEYLGDETAAFNDYTKSSQLDPQWIWPKHELARFHRDAEVADPAPLQPSRRRRFDAVGSAAAPTRKRRRRRNPTTADIDAFLQQNWPRFQDRFGRLASHPGESAQLVSVQNLLCVRYEGVSECSFDLTARYANNVDVTRRLWDGFNFDDQGKVGEVSIIINEYAILPVALERATALRRRSSPPYPSRPKRTLPRRWAKGRVGGECSELKGWARLGATRSSQKPRSSPRRRPSPGGERVGIGSVPCVRTAISPREQGLSLPGARPTDCQKPGSPPSPAMSGRVAGSAASASGRPRLARASRPIPIATMAGQFQRPVEPIGRIGAV